MDVMTMLKNDQAIRRKFDQMEQQITETTTEEQCQKLNGQFENKYPGYTITGITVKTIDGKFKITRKPLDRKYQIEKTQTENREVFYYDSSKNQWLKESKTGPIQPIPSRMTLENSLRNSQVDPSQLPPYLTKQKVKTKEK